MNSGMLPETEGVHAGTRGLDAMRGVALVQALIEPHGRALEVALAAAPEIARAIEGIAARLRAGGALHYVGAGTSGRLGVLDASECPPTFGTPPALVQGHIAGGEAALRRAIEGAEDDAVAGAREIEAVTSAADAVVGLSAGGGAPYVVAALQAARERGAFTVAVVNVGGSALAAAAECAIVVATGPEPLSGSTRLVAGTAQKLVLNALSTGVMVHLGRVYDNVMVDVVATNVKLRRRATRLVRTLAGADEAQAARLLEAAGGSVKVAVAMARRGTDAASARALLEASGGSLRAVIGDPR